MLHQQFEEKTKNENWFLLESYDVVQTKSTRFEIWIAPDEKMYVAQIFFDETVLIFENNELYSK